jgi:hypothetical protein
MAEIKDKIGLKGRCHVQLFGPDGKLKDESIVMNTVTEVGDAHVADQLSDAGENAMSHMAIGTDNDPAPAASQTTLNAELDRNALTSTTQGAGAADNDVIYVGDWAAGDGTGAIVEAGIFNAAAAGTMLCRAIFDVKNKGAADTLKITWTFTCGAS